MYILCSYFLLTGAETALLDDPKYHTVRKLIDDRDVQAIAHQRKCTRTFGNEEQVGRRLLPSSAKLLLLPSMFYPSTSHPRMLITTLIVIRAPGIVNDKD